MAPSTGRMINFSLVVGIGIPPPPHPQECAPPLVGVGGGGEHTRLQERGWGSPNSNERTYTVVLYKCMYFVAPLLPTCGDDFRRRGGGSGGIRRPRSTISPST